MMCQLRVYKVRNRSRVNTCGARCEISSYNALSIHAFAHLRVQDPGDRTNLPSAKSNIGVHVDLADKFVGGTPRSEIREWMRIKVSKKAFATESILKTKQQETREMFWRGQETSSKVGAIREEVPKKRLKLRGFSVARPTK